MECPTLSIADLIGKKWTIILLQEVKLHGGKGFNFIQARMLHVSPKILSKRLKQLEDSKIIEKKILDGVPRRTKYKMTEKGKALYHIVTNIKRWNIKYAGVSPECLKRECVKCEFYQRH